jgi:hypothetical protein
MKTQGQFTIVLRGSTERTQKIPLGSWDGFNYLMHRLLRGETVAESEFPHYGLTIDVGPAAILSAAADYLDDGYHEKLVADLREIVEGGELEELPAEPQPVR